MAKPLVKYVIDTSVYIPYINKGKAHPIFENSSAVPLLYMSAIVIEELYAGAHDRKTIKLLDSLFDTFKKLNHLLTPDAHDWQMAGKVIAKMHKKYGFENRYLANITNDTLIALSAKKIGAAVVTDNKVDFLRIKEYVHFSMTK